MKAPLLMMAALAGTAAAAMPPCQLQMPTTGLLPSHLNIEVATRMGERHGGSDLAWSCYNITIPFLDPRKSNIGSWSVDAHMDVNATVLSTGGSLDLRRNELYSFTAPFSLIRPVQKNDLLVLTIAPVAASDFAGTKRSYDLMAAAMYTVTPSDKFSFTIGLAAAPRFITYGAMPIVSFSWQMAPQWELRFQKFMLAALYSPTERLQVGPFAAMRGGEWMVNTEEGDRIFRISSVVAGVTAEYDFHREGERKRIVYATIGSTVSTRTQFCQRNWSKESLQTRHYEPGFYVSAGVDFRF